MHIWVVYKSVLAKYFQIGASKLFTVQYRAGTTALELKPKTHIQHLKCVVIASYGNPACVCVTETKA